MITLYVSNVIRIFVESELISVNEIQNLLKLSEDQVAAIVAGDDHQLTLDNIEHFTNAFGIDVFNYQFLAEVFSGSYRHSESHKSIAHNNTEVKNLLKKIYAICEDGNLSLRKGFSNVAANKCYIDSCQLSLECLKEASYFESSEAEEESCFTGE
jgi:hypothetical protein